MPLPFDGPLREDEEPLEPGDQALASEVDNPEDAPQDEA
jgi:hypothetical protein